VIIVSCGGQEDNPYNNTNENTKNASKEDEKGSIDNKDEQELEDEEYIPAVDFSLDDGKGNNITLSDYKGKFVFINFWGTWCPYCVDEMPLLQKTYDEYKEDIEIIAVNVQSISKEKSVDYVLDWLDERDITFKNVFDMDGSIANAYHVTGYPTTYIVNREGDVVSYIPGKIDDNMMEQVLDFIFD
ncbi:MAG: TlpA family protein disulfide reductase, partial [Eubacteriales bacterium]